MKLRHEPKVLVKKVRRQFSSSSKTDLNAYKIFLTNNGWGTGGCPFLLEEPFDSIPGMIENKIIKHFLKIKD